MGEYLSSARLATLRAIANTSYRSQVEAFSTFRINWSLIPIVDAFKLFSSGLLHVGDVVRADVSEYIWDIKGVGGSRWGGQTVEALVHVGDPRKPSESLSLFLGAPESKNLGKVKLFCPHVHNSSIYLT